MIRSVLISDRMWFDQHPQAIVRFRRQRTEEFEALHNQGLQVPAFKPSFATTNQENLTWVAVVDLLQLLQVPLREAKKPELDCVSGPSHCAIFTNANRLVKN